MYTEAVFFNMKTGMWWTIIVVLFVIIVVLAWLLFTTPVPSHEPTATSTTSTSTTTTTTSSALHDRIVVTSPASGATVASTFTVTGQVPGNWSFEAQFPVQVFDPSNNKIGQAVATLEGDWMTTSLVPFTATITTTGYHGPATLVLLKDNPSGLPENDDSLEIPIIIK